MGETMNSDVPTSSESGDAFLDARASYVLPEGMLPSLIGELGMEYKVYAPKDGRFVPVDDMGDIDVTGRRALFGPKKLFFPERQELFSFDDEGNIRDSLKEGRIAVFGMRACDIRGLMMLDRYFSAPEEPFYMAIRERAFIVGLTCTEPAESCFCTQFGGISNEGLDYDIWLTPLEDGYLAEVGSGRGRALLNNLGLERADDVHFEKKEALIKEVEGRMGWERIPERRIFDALKEGVEHHVWKELAERCFACGKCNMICPTCHCYDVRDEVSLNGSGERIRVWDACHLFRYGLVAGGHNFRGERLARVQYRIYDKFYYPMERYGVFACTGCGRCLEVCNADIDLREVIRTLTGGMG